MPRGAPSPTMYEKRGRFYGDFRGFAAQGGRQEALKAPGAKRATSDRNEARHLFAARLKELEAVRAGRRARGGAPTLEEAAVRYLAHLDRDKGCSERWLIQVKKHLEGACLHFGADRDITSISMPQTREYVEHLLSKDNGRGGKLSSGTARKYLNSLSGLFFFAQAEHHGVVTMNPVQLMPAKPQDDSEGGNYAFEPWEVAALVAMAQRMGREECDHGSAPFFGELVATWALTGGRKSEVTGLLVRDVDLAGGQIFFRPDESADRNRRRFDWRDGLGPYCNPFRPRLKNKRAKRIVPLWPQLREVLEIYVQRRKAEAGPDAPLFPKRGGAGIVDNVDRQLVTCGSRLGLPVTDEHGKTYVRAGRFRHSYISQRVKSTEQGRPISESTLRKEVGHGDMELIDLRYADTYPASQNPEVVEWRAEHFSQAQERLSADAETSETVSEAA